MSQSEEPPASERGLKPQIANTSLFGHEIGHQFELDSNAKLHKAVLKQTPYKPFADEQIGASERLQLKVSMPDYIQALPITDPSPKETKADMLPLELNWEIDL